MGIAPECFWSYTPAETMRVFSGARKRLEHADQRAILAGWIAAYCQRAKRFPTLKSLLQKTGKRQSLEEQARVFEALIALQAAKTE